jgi:hypothetical protein
MPATSALLDVKSTTAGWLWPRITTQQRLALSPLTAGLMVFDTNLDRLMVVNGAGQWRFALTSDFWTGSGNTLLYHLGEGVGIGNSVFNGKFMLSQGNLRIENGELNLESTSGPSKAIRQVYTGNSPDGYNQGLRFLIGGTQMAAIQYTRSATAGEDALRLSFNTIPQTFMRLKSKGELVLNHLDPILQLQQAGVNTGFAQLSGNDFRMGTNAGNPTGNFIIRNAGNNHVYITPNNRVGIGISNPQQVLDVQGSVFALSLSVNSQFWANNVQITQTLRKPSVSSAALIPLGYGSVWANGTHRSVTPNVNVEKLGTGAYIVNCPGIDEQSMMMVTVADERYQGSGRYYAANKMIVDIFYDSSTAPPPRRDSDFCFVIFKR